MKEGVCSRKTIRKYLAPALAEGLAPCPAELFDEELWRARIGRWFPELVDPAARALTWSQIAAHHEWITCALAVSSAFAGAVLWLDKIIDAWTRSCPSGRLPHGDGSRHVPPLSKVEPFSDSAVLVLRTGSIRSRGLSDPVCRHVAAAVRPVRRIRRFGRRP